MAEEEASAAVADGRAAVARSAAAARPAAGTDRGLRCADSFAISRPITAARAAHFPLPRCLESKLRSATARGAIAGRSVSRLKKGRPRARALEVGGALSGWDTEENCGVLVYLLLADRDVEIVADRGIHAKVGVEAWAAICRDMEKAFRERRFEEGVIAGIVQINALLAEHFPRTGSAGSNELPDRPVML